MCQKTFDNQVSSLLIVFLTTVEPILGVWLERTECLKLSVTFITLKFKRDFGIFATEFWTKANRLGVMLLLQTIIKVSKAGVN